MNPLAALGRAGVRAIDSVLLRHYRVFTFSNSPECIFRLALMQSQDTMSLSDGTSVTPGETFLELHFWNERLPIPQRDGAGLGWGTEFIRRIHRSLCELAVFLAREPRFDSIRVLHGEMGFVEFEQFGNLGTFVQRLGFDFIPGDAPGWRFWTYAFWANLFSWWLMWTFNPASLRGKHFRHMARAELWMSRTTLMNRYGGKKE